MTERDAIATSVTASCASSAQMTRDDGRILRLQQQSGAALS